MRLIRQCRPPRPRSAQGRRARLVGGRPRRYIGDPRRRFLRRIDAADSRARPISPPDLPGHLLRPRSTPPGRRALVLAQCAADYSVEEHVSRRPPIFLAHAADDPIANVGTASPCSRRCAPPAAGRAARLQHGGHSWGMAPGSEVAAWPYCCQLGSGRIMPAESARSAPPPGRMTGKSILERLTARFCGQFMVQCNMRRRPGARYHEQGQKSVSRLDDGRAGILSARLRPVRLLTYRKPPNSQNLS